MSAVRKRSANFSEDEKMRFVRILQNKGQVITSKVTSHDMQTNRLKEEAWTEVTSDLNASGTVLRTTENLKKLWQKLKTEAKIFKLNAYNQLRGTGGGPSKKMDDPVLELVAEITGRGSSGIDSVNDCDFGISNTNTDLDVDGSSPALCHKIIDSQSAIDLQNEGASYFEVNIDVDNTISKTQEDNEVNMVDNMVKIKPIKTKDSNLNRRRPAHNINMNERSEIQDKRLRLNNTFASERLKCETGKLGLIELQKEHMMELHSLKIKQTKLKTQIMEAVLKEIQDKKPVDPAIIKAIMTDTTDTS